MEPTVPFLEAPHSRRCPSRQVLYCFSHASSPLQCASVSSTFPICNFPVLSAAPSPHCMVNGAYSYTNTGSTQLLLCPCRYTLRSFLWPFKKRSDYVMPFLPSAIPTSCRIMSSWSEWQKILHGWPVPSCIFCSNKHMFMEFLPHYLS
jgi:hypothetical protein